MIEERRMIGSWARAAAAAVFLASNPTFAAQIVVGQVGPMSGLEASQGRAYAAGMQLRFDAINRVGGVNGHTFTLVRKDDGGRPEDTVALTKALIAEERPLVLAGYIGARNIDELIAAGVLAKVGIALVGYRSADMRPDTPLLYGVRATLRDEINKITEHLATIGITRLGLLYEAGSDAPALTGAVQEAAKRAGVQIVTRASYPANTTEVGSAVLAFLKQPPQAIILVSSGAASAGFIEGYRAGGGSAQLFAHSGADLEQLSKRLSEEQLQGVAIAQVTPSPYRISSRLAKELVDAVNAKPNKDTSISYAMMEGYITAGVIVEAVRRLGRTPTREGMPSALDSIQNFDLGGYVVSYRPGQRSGSRFIELSIVSSSGKIRQ
jgi:branched-chain amino acid transport system substrate-binding protein